jgi:hypothetical protein
MLSLRLWFGVGRSIPRIPLVTASRSLWYAEFPLSLLLLAVLLFSLFSTRSRYLVAVVVLTSFLVVLDLTRLQPWVYQYVLMITTLPFAKAGHTEPNEETIIIANQLIVASLYFWSGAQKLNWTFAHVVFSGLLEDAGIHVPLSSSTYLSGFAILIALIEAVTGVGLLIRRTRRIAVVVVVVLHLSVLVLLVLARRNTVVWPWNIVMLLVVPILFWRIGDSVVRKELWRWRPSTVMSYLPKLAIILCALAPAFSFMGWWDLYLSAALYSGNAPVGVVRLSDQFRSQVSEAAKEQIFASSRGEAMLPLHEWSEVELNVPPYPEARAYRQLTRQVCEMIDNSEEIELFIKSRPRIRDGSYTVERNDCRALQK